MEGGIVVEADVWAVRCALHESMLLCACPPGPHSHLCLYGSVSVVVVVHDSYSYLRWGTMNMRAASVRWCASANVASCIPNSIAAGGGAAALPKAYRRPLKSTAANTSQYAPAAA